MEYMDVFGERLSKIGFGTWQMRGDSCREGVVRALEMGYRHIDTAEYYQNEEAVGQAVEQSGLDREDVFLTSKVWSNHFREDEVQQACEQSLMRLGVDYLDLYLIHHPSDVVPLEETLAGMQALVEQNKTRYIGVSNFSVSLLKKARLISSVPIFTDQVKFHPFHRQDDLLDYCQEHGLMLTAYSPLAQGGVLGDRLLKEIGERYDKSPAQVALRWAVQQDMVIAIPKASSVEHQRANLEIFDFKLTPGEMEKIAQLS